MTLRTKVIVTGLSYAARKIVTLRLSAVDGAALPNWSPGAHVGLYLPNGLIREYSLVSEPTDCESWVLAIYREPDSRGGSAFIHEQLRIGTIIEVDGPKNHFTLEPAVHRYHFVAGGIGVAPMVAMIGRLEFLSMDWRMLYAGRSIADMAFIDTLRAQYGNRVVIHTDDTAGGPPDLTLFLGAVGAEDLVYCCGPESLIEATKGLLADEHLIRVERFRAPSQPSGGSAFEVVLGHSGERIGVGESESLLDALERSGITIPRSCTEGICGTCEVGVLDGDIDHRDYLLTPPERARNDVMMTCVSRARTPSLTLDLPLATDGEGRA